MLSPFGASGVFFYFHGFSLILIHFHGFPEISISLGLIWDPSWGVLVVAGVWVSCGAWWSEQVNLMGLDGLSCISIDFEVPLVLPAAAV